MGKKIFQAFSLVLISWLAATWQFSLVSAWPAAFSQINIILTVIILAIFFLGLRTALIFSLLLGFWMDINSFYFFGLHLITLFLVLVLAYWILENWLTNRSLYSFLFLFFLSTLAYNIIFSLWRGMASGNQVFLFFIQKDFWLNLWYQTLWGLLAAILSFHLLAFLTKRMRPEFLEKKSFL